MGYVVRRPAGRWEVRESVVTPSGPRARSLATFRVLDSAVLDRAERAARRPFDRQAAVASARRAGAPVEDSEADRLARQLLGEIARRRGPAPGLRRLLRDNLADRRSMADVEMDLEWLSASDEERGRTLRDLLDLGDQFRAERRGPLKFPSLMTVVGDG
jgi:hypothetical protein